MNECKQFDKISIVHSNGAQTNLNPCEQIERVIVNDVVVYETNAKESSETARQAAPKTKELLRALVMADHFCDEGNCTLMKNSLNAAMNIASSIKEEHS